MKNGIVDTHRYPGRKKRRNGGHPSKLERNRWVSAISPPEVLEERVQARRVVFDRYVKALADLPGIEPQAEAEGCRHSRWLSCFVVDEAKFGMSAYDLIRYLENRIGGHPWECGGGWCLVRKHLEKADG